MNRNNFKPQTSGGKFQYIVNRSYDPRKEEKILEKKIRDHSRSENTNPDFIVGVWINFETGEFECHNIEFKIGENRFYQSVKNTLSIFQRFQRLSENIIRKVEIFEKYPSNIWLKDYMQKLREKRIPLPDRNDIESSKYIRRDLDFQIESKLIEIVDFFEERTGSLCSEQIFLNNFNKIINYESFNIPTKNRKFI